MPHSESGHSCHSHHVLYHLAQQNPCQNPTLRTLSSSAARSTTTFVLNLTLTPTPHMSCAVSHNIPYLPGPWGQSHPWCGVLHSSWPASLRLLPSWSWSLLQTVSMEACDSRMAPLALLLSPAQPLQHQMGAAVSCFSCIPEQLNLCPAFGCLPQLNE